MDRCVVILDERPEDDEIDEDYRKCDKPAVGERGGWPMCAEHLELFNPERDKIFKNERDARLLAIVEQDE
jgi:hypothetical protein